MTQVLIIEYSKVRWTSENESQIYPMLINSNKILWFNMNFSITYKKLRVYLNLDNTKSRVECIIRPVLAELHRMSGTIWQQNK